MRGAALMRRPGLAALLSAGPLRAGLLCAALLVASGCMPSLESNEPAERVYWLETVELDDGVAGAEVRVAVVPGLDTDRILVLEADRRLNYFAGAFWPDNLRPLLQSILERSLAARDPGGTFLLTVERFFALRAASGAISGVTLRARIDRAGGGGSCLFQETVTPASERLRDLVAAHQQLLDGLAREIDGLARGSPGTRADC